MSFILDALKKSESERHRNSGPVLMDVRIAPPRRRLPAWAWIIIAVLAVNLLVLVWLLWLAPDRAAPAQSAAATSPAQAAPQTLPVPAPAATPPAASAMPEPALPPAAPPPVSPQPTVAPAAAMPPGPALDVAALGRYKDLVSSGISMPTLQLNLHVYDAAPASRYVMVNGARLREGETAPDGLRVLQITPTGVALEWRTQRFFLAAGG